MVCEATEEFILNEAAVRDLGWTPETALGQTILYNRREARVVGVVKDFHQASLHEPIEPMILYMIPARSRPLVVVRLAGFDIKETLASLRVTWNQFVPDLPLEFFFLDEKVEQQYVADRRFEHICRVSSTMAIVVACLGLFGLSAFITERRTKEIGVRKVLGANTAQIFGMLSREFILLTIVAFTIVAPIGWVTVRDWLDGFEYRISPGPGLFMMASGVALGITLLATTWQAVRAAMGDPVNALRDG